MAERFLTIDEVCNRAGYVPNTVYNKRSLGKTADLKLPPLIKRGDGRLGCLESVLDKFLVENYGGAQS